MRKTLMRTIAFAVVFWVGGFFQSYAADVNVFAAASLKNALEAIASDWREETGLDASLTFAASSAVARQIEQGAPADIFISANLDWMDYLEEAGEIKAETRVNLASNTLVLVGPSKGEASAPVDEMPNLKTMLDGGRLAVGTTESVPAGRYAKAALEYLGQWIEVKDQLAEAENVRAALALVSRDEAPLGIVYATDARIDPGVKVLATFPKASYPPIIYPAAITTISDASQAAEFLTYLKSQKAQARFRDAGFQPLAQSN